MSMNFTLDGSPDDTLADVLAQRLLEMGVRIKVGEYYGVPVYVDPTLEDDEWRLKQA